MHAVLRILHDQQDFALYELTFRVDSYISLPFPRTLTGRNSCLILDNKKSRLQVNKEALRRAIRRHSEKTMSSITESKAKVKRSLISTYYPCAPLYKLILMTVMIRLMEMTKSLPCIDI